ncbi:MULTISPECIES: hypothetical protein [unclassified Corynebacterium]|uniref:hypothetical protein n=1 Tax=unclassified Corynebacterium TaxID=2624378 RepID=UPI0029CAA782|nr:MULTISPECIES: hypothetical protein [unclassified Corynebacterium]WPF66328.1 hypothetical protein OLX12_00945 [Corynebacterium sp. 22KM0430]WPF68818.1 hypothetical protein OLW90_00945 [Corynebacterium sp. 21KM1197]
MPEELENYLDRVMDEFYKVGVEADYLFVGATSQVSWTITVEAMDEAEGRVRLYDLWPMP